MKFVLAKIRIFCRKGEVQKAFSFSAKEFNMANEEKLALIRHSMSHVMAEAVLEMFPTAQIAIGPAIENGFYYDFELPRQLVNEDLDEITERMKKIIKSDK